MIAAWTLGASLIGLAVQPEPLAGPAVKTHGRSGLVQHEMSGRVVRPEKTVEEAAADRLVLTPDVRERIDRVVAERAAAIDRFVTENLLLLNQLDTVGKAGSLRDKIVLGTEAITKLGAAIEGKRLKDDILAQLPVDQRATFHEMLREYWRALHEEGKVVKPHDPPPPWAVSLGESLASLGREIARSFERQSAAGTVFVDYLLSGLNLSEAQKAVVRELKLDLMEKTGMKASEEDQGKLVLSVAAYLSQEQREIVLARVRGVMPEKKKRGGEQ
jgi:hypothetical protein